MQKTILIVIPQAISARYIHRNTINARSFALSLSMDHKGCAHVLEILSIECELVERL